MIPVAFLFFLSGFAALVYELLWFRQLGFIFGNTVHAATAVLTAYMAGLAFGARWFGRRVKRSKNPIRLFGILETAIGFYALLVPILFLLVRYFYRFLYQNTSDALSYLSIVRFLLGMSILIVPTFFMGGTLPVLTQAMARRDENFSSRLSWLYGINTLGAMSGILVAGFIMIPTLGLRGANLSAVAVNLLIGAAAFVFSKDFASHQGQANDSAGGAEQDAAGPLAVKAKIAVWTALLAGFVGLALEVVWFRTLVLVFGSTTYSFSVMLAVFLLGLAAGSMCFGWLADRLKDHFGMIAIGFLLVGAATTMGIRLFLEAPEFLLQYLADRSFSWGHMIQAKFIITLAFLLIPTLTLGFLFNVIAKVVRSSDESSGDAVGRVYWYNTFGAVLGSLAGGFILLPWLGMQSSLTLLAALALVAGILIALVVRPVRSTRLVIAALAACLTVVTIWGLPRWDPRIMASGAYFIPQEFVHDGEVIFWQRIAKQHIRYYEEGVVSTVSVTETMDQNLYFTSGGKVEVDTSRRTMALSRLQGHMPMLFHPNPRRVMNIGLGAGVTFGALSRYPTDHLEVVEIAPSVKEVARIWGPHNHDVMANEDAIFTIGDARNHLFSTANLYDVITSDPFEPVVAGAGHLFTVEHFAQAKARLAPGGIMGQWIPMYEMSKRDFFTIMRSFAEVFPDSVLFFTGSDTIMLGLRDGGPLEYSVVKEKFAIPEVKEALSEMGVVAPETILGMFVADLSVVLETAPEADLNSDNFPRIEFNAPKSALQTTTLANAEVLVENFTEIPASLVSQLSESERQRVQDGHRALYLTLEAIVMRSKAQGGASFTKLQEAMELAPDNPIIRSEGVITIMRSADVMQAHGHMDQAALQFGLALRYEPDTFWAIYKLFHLHMMAGRTAQAEQLLEMAHELFPEAASFWALHGKYRMSSGEPELARPHYETALKYSSWRSDLWRDYAACLRLLSQYEESTQALAKAQELDSELVMARAIRAEKASAAAHTK